MWMIVRDIVIEDLRRLLRRVLRRPDPPLPYARLSPGDPAQASEDPRESGDDCRAS